MTPEQAERAASSIRTSRELRGLRAQEQIAASLEGIHQTLAMWFYKMYEEDCAENVEKWGSRGHPAEVVLKKDTD